MIEYTIGYDPFVPLVEEEMPPTVCVAESEPVPLTGVQLSKDHYIKEGALLYNPRVDDMRRATTGQCMNHVDVELNFAGTESMPWLKGDKIYILNSFGNDKDGE